MKKDECDSRFMNPLTDFGFNWLFGTEPSKKFLISFLNEVLKEEGQITDIRYLPPEQRGFTEKERKAVFDILCTNNKEEYFIVEMQKSRQTYFKERSIFYASLQILKQAPRGIWNFRLKAVYFVAVLDFIIFKEFKDDKDYVIEYVSLIRERTKTYFSKKLNFAFIELPKFNKTEDELKTNLDIWLYTLKNLSKLEKLPAIIQGKIFEELFQVAELKQLTKEEMRTYKKSILEYRDVRDSIEFAREEAREETREEARKEAREEANISIIQKCFQNNIPIEVIINLTGFSREDIVRYANCNSKQ